MASIGERRQVPDGDAIVQVAEWCGGRFTPGGAIVVTTPDGEQRAERGDWIQCTASGWWITRSQG